MKIHHAAGALALSGLLAACGGAQSTSPIAHAATPAPGATPTTAPIVTVTPTAPPPGVTSSEFVISLAGGTGATIQSGRRYPKYVSSSTQSVTFSVDGGAATRQDLTGTSTNCSTSNGGVQCAVPLPGIAAGNHTLALTAWSGAAGTGSKLGANSAITFTVVANQANVVSGIIGGIATSIALVPANNGATGSFTSGFTVLYAGQPQGFTAEALDAAGNIIVGPGAPSIVAQSQSGGYSTAAGTLPNTFTVSIPPGEVTGPSKNVIGGLQLTLTPVAASGGTPITVTTNISVREPTLYALYTNGKVVAYDALGNQEPHPNAGDAINGGTNLGIAYSSQGKSLVAYTTTLMTTYNSAGQDATNSLLLGGVTLAPVVFAWDTASNTGYGFDTVSQKLVQFGPTENPTTITLLGAAQAAPFTALTGNQMPLELPVASNSDALYAATTSGVELLADDASASSPFSAPNVGNVTAVAFDPVQRNLFVVGLNGVAIYRNGASTPSTIPGLTGELAIAFNPDNGFVYIANFSSSKIYAIDATGAIQFSFPMPSGLSALQLVFAP
jgi:hypothetical protein